MRVPAAFITLMFILPILILNHTLTAFAAPTIEQRQALADAYQCSLAFKIKGQRSGDQEAKEKGEQLELQIRRAYKTAGADENEVNMAMNRYAALVGEFPNERIDKTYESCKPDIANLYWKASSIADGGK